MEKNFNLVYQVIKQFKFTLNEARSEIALSLLHRTLFI